jgi:hypothetical protein
MRLSRASYYPFGRVVKEVHLVVGVLAVALNAFAGLLGAWRWHRVEQSTWFWRLLRGGQAVVIVEVLLGGVWAAMGHKPSGLHLVYGLLPLLVSFIAEQLRLASAAMVLDQRGFQSAADVGRRPEAEQQHVALAIVQREMGVMAIAALVVVVLLVRAATTA